MYKQYVKMELEAIEWSGLNTIKISLNFVFRENGNRCKIWGFHGGDYDDYHLLGDDAVWLL
jgi:hypothetical protein